MAAVYIPQIDARTLVNHAAIVTAGEEAILASLPEWSAVNSAELLMEGTEAQRTLGRDTLLEALQQPWSVTNPDFIEGVVAMAPFADGSRAAVLTDTPAGSAFAVIDTDGMRFCGRCGCRARWEACR